MELPVVLHSSGDTGSGERTIHTLNSGNASVEIARGFAH